MFSKSLSYGAICFSCAAMHNIFITYYIHFFMESYMISDNWFYFGEIIFMIWNSFNDPFFGWIINQYQGENSKLRIQLSIIIIRYGGILWCFAFIFVFIPLSNLSNWIGFHFLLSLCLYDGMLSLVMLTHGALLADITIDSKERAECNMWSSTFSLIGSCSVLIAQFFWDKDNVFVFQIFCLILGIISCIIFIYTSTKLSNEFSYKKNNNNTMNSFNTQIYNELRYIVLIKLKNINQFFNLKALKKLQIFYHQLKKLPNFWIFMIINLIQVFNCHFNSNFLSISMERLLQLDHQELSSRQISSILLTASALFPHLLVIIFTPFQKKYGLHRLLSILFFWKLIVALFVFIFGSINHWMLIFVFIFINKSFSECICRHGNLVVANIVDEDKLINNRVGSNSSLIFGANALFTKPGQSIAPVVGWSVLTYNNFRDSSQDEDLNTIMFSMLCLVPLTCGIIQYLLWQQFSLKGEYLKQIKESLSKNITWGEYDI